MKIIKPLYLSDKNLISYLLAPLTVFTFLINFSKKFSVKKKYKIKTICVGNIYIGGTGKTSLCIEINKILKNKFKTVFIKKRYLDQLDERKMLQTHGKLISEENRDMSLDKAEAKKFNLAILDDGLQDKKIDYDISIACFNSSYGIGNGYLLPAGPLREKLEILKKYSAIFVIGERKNTKLLSVLKKFNNKIFYSNYVPINMKNFNRKKSYLYFCGIGNPEEFENTLNKYKFKISKKFIFPDHHNYTNKDLEKIKRIALKEKLEIITTEKDYKRLTIKNKKSIKFLKVELKIENLKKFKNFLKEKI
jgi:tetraacyldisaccharide 4'-kinase